MSILTSPQGPHPPALQACTLLHRDSRPLHALRDKAVPMDILATLLTFLVERNDALGDGLADGVDLADVAATAHADANVYRTKPMLAKQQNWLQHLPPQSLGLHQLQWRACVRRIRTRQNCRPFNRVVCCLQHCCLPSMQVPPLPRTNMHTNQYTLLKRTIQAQLALAALHIRNGDRILL